jgi:hypothetical protein
MDWTAQTIATVVQTVASIIALGIATAAVVIPARQRQRREKAEESERRLEARCLATAIQFDLNLMHMSLSNLQATAITRSTDNTRKGPPVPDFVAAKIAIPQILSENINRVYILGSPAGPTLLRLHPLLAIYNELVDREANRFFTNPDISEMEHWRALIGFIAGLMPAVEKASKEIDRIAAE